MSEHTPTPWKDAGEHSLTGYGDINHVIVGSDGKTVGSLYANCFAAPHMNELPTVEEASSNATLILKAVNGYAEAVAETERLRKAIQDYLDGNYENPRRHRNDGGPNKWCAHGRFYWEDCSNCIEDYFAGVLNPQTEGKDL